MEIDWLLWFLFGWRWCCCVWSGLNSGFIVTYLALCRVGNGNKLAWAEDGWQSDSIEKSILHVICGSGLGWTAGAVGVWLWLRKCHAKHVMFNLPFSNERDLAPNAGKCVCVWCDCALEIKINELSCQRSYRFCFVVFFHFFRWRRQTTLLQ